MGIKRASVWGQAGQRMRTQKGNNWGGGASLFRLKATKHGKQGMADETD